MYSVNISIYSLDSTGYVLADYTILFIAVNYIHVPLSVISLDIIQEPGCKETTEPCIMNYNANDFRYYQEPESHMRNQFVTSANERTAREGSVFGDYTRGYQVDPAKENRNNDAAYGLPRPGGWSKNEKGSKSDVGVNDYELQTYEPYSSRDTNPFRSEHDDSLHTEYDNPFSDRDLPPLPSQRYRPLDVDDPMKGGDSEYRKMRKNEKARIKQLNRKPRFHYTRLPYFTMLVTLIQIIVFIVELAKMGKYTGSPIQTKPYFNPMIGPSTYVMINMGARYAPCMHLIKDVTDDTSIQFPCPNSTDVKSNVCSLSQLCGLSGVPEDGSKYKPHQWYRIVTPIFLHAGFIHIIFNLLLQTTMGATIERHIGFIKYFLVYMPSGIAGFLLGSNFSPDGIASTGASGALFGILAADLIMFIYCGRKNTNIYGTKKFGLFLTFLVAEIIISFVLGLLPGMDNFSHIGGFAMGILTSVVLIPDPFFIYVDGIITYNAHDNTAQQFLNNWNPFYHYEDKIPYRFYLWCVVRIVCLVLAILFIALLLKNFYSSDSPNQHCSWCKYINCIPVHGWCDMGQVSVQSNSS